ncbi:MAG: exo-alpha-sialidase [Magnetospirillum sp.]|nr:exo-alpha-sialidase [Magnetospirillum sp.]
MHPRIVGLLCLLLLTSARAEAQHGGSHHGTPARSDCTALGCAATASPALGDDGRLWVTWSAGGRVWVAASNDLGQSFAPAIAVSGAPATIDDNGEARPVVAVDGKRIAVAYTVRRPQGYTGTLMLTRSTDGGGHFSPPRPVTADPASQRFAALIFAPGGPLVVAWLDKRRAGGSAVAVAISADGGGTMAPERLFADRACECCRVALAVDGNGRTAVLWRAMFPGGIRDHALTTLAPDGTPGAIRRVAVGEWKIDACPHHGPSLAVAAYGGMIAAWYTGGRARQGLVLARSGDGGATFSAPLALGEPERLPSHPQVLAVGATVWAAWKEFDGTRTTVAAIVSADGGLTWAPPRVLAATADASDYPLLVGDGARGYLSWLTRAEGYRLLPLPTEVGP